MEYLNFSIAILALFLSAFAIYWQFLRKPNLDIEYQDYDPYRKFLIPKKDIKSYDIEWFIRAKVINKNKVIAINCFGKIIECYTNNEKVINFDPIKLHWVSKSPNDYSPINLSYKEFDYIDLFYTDTRKDTINIYSNTHERGTPIEFKLRETHHFKFVVYCENESYKYMYYKVWYVDKDPEGKFRFPLVKKISENDYNKLNKSL